ncbi:unnamed protein product [Clonostachys rosea]|uniref:General alpha-glucoside permease n=1 Tax=Bionectria ochroleuca TaxID=29856 RepID=A0ABY6UB54_BIOOC|nr:unnamed protein product [Clonostachys rosea]
MASSSSQLPSSSREDQLRVSVQEPDRPVNENSPLLSANDDSSRPTSPDADDTDAIDASQETKSFWYLVLLALGIGGLQLAWSVELSNGSPYLLSLGLSKSLMALVWIAGPLTGTLVQPYVGMLSDNCRLRWGLFGADPQSAGVKNSVIVVAVIGIYVLDFAINTVQAAIRAFMVDCAPAHQQEAVNAMASRLTGIGNILGYIAGNLDLPKYLWFLGDTQFKILCAIACVALGSTILLSTAAIKERDPRQDGPPPSDRPGVFVFFFTIFKSIKRLPPQIKKVCKVQFFGWVGFFPLLFYTSSYIGEIYVEPYLEKNPNMTPEELDKLYEQATRVGTFALLVNSIVSLMTNLFLPFFVAPTYGHQPLMSDAPSETENSLKTYDDDHSIFDRLQIPGFTLRRAWFGSLVLFAFSMFCTVIVRSVEAATVLIGIVGITWAMALWAPWAIISAEISRRDALVRVRKARSVTSSRPGGNMSARAGAASNSGHHDDAVDDEEVDQAGVILGIHNMAIAAPQIIANVGSSIIFKIWQKPRGTPGDHSFAVVLALGGVCVLISSYFVLRIQDSPSLPADAMISVEEGTGPGDVSGPPARPGHHHRRKSSFEKLPRASLGRATLTRNKSFSGAEML